MSEPQRDDSRARLLLAILKKGSVHEELERLGAEHQLGVTLPATLRDALEATRRASLERIVELARAAEREQGPDFAEFIAYAWLALLSDEFPTSEYSRIEVAFSNLVPPDSYFWIALKCLQGGSERKAGNLNSAGFFLREATRRAESLEHPILRSLSLCLVSRVSGLVHRDRGDFTGARAQLEVCRSTSEQFQLRVEPIVTHDLASLLWASGQYEKALGLHQDAHHRASLEKNLGTAWLLDSHLCAAKCAIDADLMEIAESELRAAESLFTRWEGTPESLHGYYKKTLGEWTIRSGDLEAGLILLDEACEHFASMDPPCLYGLIDAKISIAEHAVSRRDHRGLATVIQKLLEETERVGYLEARARLTVLESALFVSENPPLREAFDDVVTRLHLINNPALLMQALWNLFTYSLRYLEENDQAFLLARLRSLSALLEGDEVILPEEDREDS